MHSVSSSCNGTGERLLQLLRRHRSQMEEQHSTCRGGKYNSSSSNVNKVVTPADNQHHNHEMSTNHDGHDHRSNSSNTSKQQVCYYTNILTSYEMDSLVALCDTLIPSIDTDDSGGQFDEAVVKFFRTSASMAGTPEYLGGLVTHRLGKRHMFLVRLGLFLLSTWIGTLILCCGSRTVITLAPRRIPRRFSKMTYEDRRDMLLGWSTSWIPIIRLMFVGIKSLVLLAFFTQVNSQNENPTWEAIGYCGPDPDATTKQRRRDMIPTTGPLDDGIIDIAALSIVKVAQRLKQNGFQVKLHHQNDTTTTTTRSSSDHSTAPAMTISCDAVVVGSGSGGGVVAAQLTKAGHKVLVLEKGSYRTRTNLTLLEGESLDQMYEGAGLLTTNAANVMILAGSTVGGGSQVNWSASIKTPDHVLAEWVNNHNLNLFGSDEYRDAMDAVCARMGVQSCVDEEGLNNQVLRDGCVKLGYPVNNIPRNACKEHYCGWCFMGCKDGKKQGGTETWLRDAVTSCNAVIMPNCEVTRVVYDSKRKTGLRGKAKAKGVVFQFIIDDDCMKKKKKKRVCVVVESRVTVIACGALNTPVLLKNSGLRNSNIGKNLHLHPVVMGWGYFPLPLPATSPPPPLQHDDGKKTTKKFSYEGGIMTSMSTIVSQFNESGYGAILQTPSLHPGLFSVLTPWKSGHDIKLRMTRFSRTAHIIALARDIGSGKVSTSSNLLLSPNIHYNLSSSDDRSLNLGLEKILRVMKAAGAEEIGTHHVSGEKLCVKKASEVEFEEFVRKQCGRGLRHHKSALASAHQMGTCRMGVDERSSVVDWRGETWEVEGLWIADTSVFPTALGVNPMVTVMAVAYCTANNVVEMLNKDNKCTTV